MRGRTHQQLQRLLVLAALAALSACGGGGGGSGGAGGGGSAARGPASGVAWTQGVFMPASNFAAQCAAPRTGFADVQGSTLSENNWLRSWTNNLYLWYDEVVDRDPALYATPAYFDLLKT